MAPLPKLALLAAAALAATTCCHAFVFPQQPPGSGQLSTQHPSSSAAPTTVNSPRGRVILQSSPFSIMKSEPASPEFSLLRQSTVLSAATGRPTTLGDAFPSGAGGKKTIVAFFTHWGDFNSFEYAQKLLHYLPQLDRAGVNVVAVGIGSVAAAQEFAALVGGFPLDRLYCDESAAAYGQFGFSRGFAADLPVNPYLKLLPMLAGIGSPGTLQAVLRGYVGDKNADASWTSDYLKGKSQGGQGLVDKSAFDVLGTEGARPFEVATVRLQNMISIIPNWERLAPADKSLITQQGGSLVFEGKKLIKVYRDKGILTYTDVNDLLRTVGVRG